MRMRMNPDAMAPALYTPLERLALCLDCEACFDISGGRCPACGCETLAPLAGFLDREFHRGRPATLHVA
jgi:hypothetical protein